MALGGGAVAAAGLVSWNLMRAGLLFLMLLVSPLMGQVVAETKHAETYPAFRDAEVYLIHDYFRPGAGHSVSAVATKGLKMGAALPVELEKKLEDFPEPLSKRLPPAPAGYSRKICGRVGVLVQNATNLVVDMVALVRQR
jgi:hypothetical protein